MKNVGHNPLLIGLILDSPTPRPIAYAEQIIVISTTTHITYVEDLYKDSATLTTTTSITIGEFDYVHPTGSWGAFDTDNGAI